MPADLRELIRTAAPRPHARLDVDAIWRRGRRMRAARRLTALVLVSTLGVGAWAFEASDVLDRRALRPAHREPWSDFSLGWTRLPPPPEVRDGAAWAWTGSMLLGWGGCGPATSNRCHATADGYLFDPTLREWRRIPPAPVPGSHARAAWTGREALFLTTRGDARLVGQAYDPARRAWRTLARAPMPARAGAVAVWSGSELIVWGGGEPNDHSAARGAAYDPASDRWRRISTAPLRLNHASGLWTGKEMIVFGSLLDARNRAETQTAVGAAYDPTTDEWRRLPPSALSPQATSAAWTGTRVVAWDYEARSQELNPARDRWSRPVTMPLEFDECYPDSVAARTRVFGYFCGQAALYVPEIDTWRRIHGGPLRDEVEADAGSYRLWRFASLVAAGDVVFLALEGITVHDGEVCYGCPGSPTSFWAFRLPCAADPAADGC